MKPYFRGRSFCLALFLLMMGKITYGQDTLRLFISDSLIYTKDVLKWNNTLSFTISARTPNECTAQFSLTWADSESELIGLEIIDTVNIKPQHFSSAESNKGSLRVLTKIIPPTGATKYTEFPLFKITLRGRTEYTYTDGRGRTFYVRDTFENQPNGPLPQPSPMNTRYYGSFRQNQPILKLSDKPLNIRAIKTDLQDMVVVRGEEGWLFVNDKALWPGEINNNGKVDQYDALALGTQIPFRGVLQRANPTLDWRAQPLLYGILRNGIPITRYDTDGNGVVNLRDTVAIHLNWGKTIPGRAIEQASPNLTSGTPLGFGSDTSRLNRSLTIPIMLGNEEKMATNAYGVAFSLRYQASVNGAKKISIDFSDSWILEGDNNPLVMYRDNPLEGRLDVAICRTDRIAQSGYGSLGRIKVTLEDVIFVEDYLKKLQLELNGIRLVDKENNPLPITQPDDEIRFKPSIKLQKNLPIGFKIFPQPSKDFLFIQEGALQDAKAKVFDLQGKLMWKGSIADGKINVSAWPSGIYVLHVNSIQEKQSYKFTVQH